jgi:hypothetical protein
MSSNSFDSAGSGHPGTADRDRGATGPFILTLCRVAGPVAIHPPQSPQMKSFRFFTSCARQPDGSERRYVHMGYFETLEDAQRWVQRVRGRFPNAVATVAPAALLPAREFAPVKDESLSDTGVMRLLEKRHERADGTDDDTAAGARREVELLPPDDTTTRRALKQAVAEGARVSFAVQLQWAERSFDLSRLPSHPMLKMYALYAMVNHREGRSRHFLRLGFFDDPLSAKDVASEVRSRYPAAAVVPVTEEERIQALESRAHTSGIPSLVAPAPEPVVDPNRMRSAAESTTPARGTRKVAADAETLEETLERLAQKEKWTEQWAETDSLSESGVRHLRVEMQDRKPGRG